MRLILLLSALATLLAGCPPGGDDDDSATPDVADDAWVVAAPSPGSSLGEDVAAMPDGGVVVIGAFADTITFDADQPNETALTSAGSFDVFLARFDADGALLWAVQAGSAGEDWGLAIDTNGAGDIWAVGRFTDTATFGAGDATSTDLIAEENSDLFVARYDADGVLVHAHRAGGPNNDVATGVAVADDGGAFVAGFIWAFATFGPGEANEVTIASLGAQDGILARYAPDGTFSWVKTMTGGGSVVARDIAATADGGVLISGEFTQQVLAGEGDPAETSLYSIAGNLDSFLVRYAGDGTLEWARNDSTGLPDQGVSVAADGDDAVHVGNFRGSGTFGAGQPGETELQSGGFDDGYVARLDATGQLVFVRQAGGTATQGSTLPSSVAIASGVGAVVVGQYSGNPAFGVVDSEPVALTPVGEGDLFVAAWGADGSFLFAHSGGGSMSDSANGVAVSGGAAYVTGWFGGDASFDIGDGAVTATATGGAEFYLLRHPL